MKSSSESYWFVVHLLSYGYFNCGIYCHYLVTRFILIPTVTFRYLAYKNVFHREDWQLIIRSQPPVGEKIPTLFSLLKKMRCSAVAQAQRGPLPGLCSAACLGEERGHPSSESCCLLTAWVVSGHQELQQLFYCPFLRKLCQAYGLWTELRSSAL